MMEELINLLKSYWKRQKFEYRFLVYDGTEDSKNIEVSNSIEFELINSGTSKCIINDTLILYPAFMGIEPTRVKLSMNKNEVDDTVYEYRFVAVGASDIVAGSVGTAASSVNTALLFNPTGYRHYDRLVAIVKQVSTK